MNRLKRHKIKSEMPETSVKAKEHDLAYYIHDRVELMHQVFSVLKAKDLTVMAPECVRNISKDDLQELCTEELLGISSKRLCAILDGAEPPTDTESSSSEQLETVSLDSISSDDEVLSQHSHKCKHKHKKHRSNNKRHKCKNSAPQDENAASRGGLTVLELLELQARARAIRAQLQQDNLVSAETLDLVEETDKNGSSDEVEIKEEPPEVVEISSEDEKPRIEDLPVLPPSPSKNSTTESLETKTTVTKRVNDLIITVPKTKTTRKIKLNRSKTAATATTSQAAPTDKISEPNKNVKNEVVIIPDNTNKEKVESKAEKGKLKKKQKKKAKIIEKDGSDHDEITLQLSDTEKMDLLNFDRKNYDMLTSSSSEDSESESSDPENTIVVQKSSTEKEKTGSEKVLSVKSKSEISNDKTISSENIVDIDFNEAEVQPINYDKVDSSINLKDNEKADSQNYTLENKNSDNNIKEVENITDAQKDNLNNKKTLEKDNLAIEDVTDMNKHLPNKVKSPVKIDFDIEIVTDTHTDMLNDTKSPEEANLNIKDKCPDKVLSATENIEEHEDGEITHEEEKKSGEVPGDNSEVVCISDNENKSKKKRKKEKKSKKDKKNKKSKSDFREDGDQNFYKKNGCEEQINKSNNTTVEADEIVISNNADNVAINNDIYEILELSDDSSCYEVEGVSILSEIPTKAEIEALSAKIDEETREKSKEGANIENSEEIENISWRDRYLDSKKVKKVLTTANILNAIRKRNIELKKKLEESKGEEKISEVSTKNEKKREEPITSDVVEGSIDHFNALQGSAKYVDPGNGEKVTKDLEVDAKRLLKMYKRLSKIMHNIYEEKDTNKKKKKNREKKEDTLEKSV